MKKLILTLLLVGAVVAGLRQAARRAGPGIGEGLMEKCHRLMEGMPDDFPPKRIAAGFRENTERLDAIREALEAIRQNTERSVQLLERLAEAE